MHYYGPYSETLDGNLSLSDAMGIVEIKADSAGYGYHIKPGKYPVKGVETQCLGKRSMRRSMNWLNWSFHN